jgi:D-tyrosyl-tRNA(Tyr) deacylase
MRAVIQRVTDASVTVEGERISAIGHGMMILLGVEVGDTEEDLDYLLRKIIGLRVFDDDEGVMNRDIREVEGEILLVSQFTLLASTKKGNRPSYIRAAKGPEAEPMYERMADALTDALGREVKQGIFGADMQVRLTNDGPVTIFIDSRQR